MLYANVTGKYLSLIICSAFVIDHNSLSYTYTTTLKYDVELKCCTHTSLLYNHICIQTLWRDEIIPRHDATI